MSKLIQSVLNAFQIFSQSVRFMSHCLLQNPSAPGMHNMPNSRDSHIRVSYKDNPGFFQKVQQSFCASLFGILLVIASFPVIYWNEVRKIIWIIRISFFSGVKLKESLRKEGGGLLCEEGRQGCLPSCI